MSSGEGETGGETRPRREVAHRVFAAEFDDSEVSYSESEEERAPNYVVTPTGARANRVIVAGVLTELDVLGSDQLRARIADPTGAFVVYAGQYQPEALAALEGLEPPAFVAVTGKARTFRPEDSDRVFTSIRPETVSEIDAATRDRWIVETAARTLDRVGELAVALLEDGGGDGSAGTAGGENAEGSGGDDPQSGISLAREFYGTTPTYLAAVRGVALDAARLVAGEGEAVRPLDVAPDEAGEADLDVLAAGPTDGNTVAALTDGDGDAVGGIEDDDGDEGEVETPASGSATPERTGPGEAADTDAISGIEDNPETTGADSSQPLSAGDPGEEAAASGTDEGLASEPGTTEGGGSEADDSPGANAGEPGGDPDPVEGVDDEAGEEFDGEFELSDEERAEIEAEYGTDFASGSEIDEAGEADIEPTAPPVAEDEEGAAPPADDSMASEAGATDEFGEIGGAGGTGETGGTSEIGEVDTDEPAETTAGETSEASDASEASGAENAEPADTRGDEPAIEDEPEPELGSEPGVDAGSDLDTDSGPDTGEVDEPEPAAGTERDERNVDVEAMGGERPADEEPTAEEGGTTDEGETAKTAEGGDGVDTRSEDVDATEAVMDAMRELDDGDGAERGSIVERIGEQYGIGEDEAETAVQDALMGGRCYDAGDGKLKAI
jgi:RPA family protein